MDATAKAKEKPEAMLNPMQVQFTIHLGRGQFCRCFSERDLGVNVEFCIREGMKIEAVEKNDFE